LVGNILTSIEFLLAAACAFYLGYRFAERDEPEALCVAAHVYGLLMLMWSAASLAGLRPH
jgi:hypothetical protein